MRTEAIKILKFDELSEDAQENAISNWRTSGHGYAWSDEWLDSLKAFAEVIGIKITDYSIGPYSYSYIKWEFSNYDTPPNAHYDENEEMTGLRLRTWIINNWLPLFESKKTYYTKGYQKKRISKIFIEYDQCNLTGYCGDYCLVNTILEHIKDFDRGYTLRDIVNDCLEEFIKDWNTDCEYQDSDEYIIEHLEANEYEFTEDGEMC